MPFPILLWTTNEEADIPPWTQDCSPIPWASANPLSP
jgi:hypothetical protein